MVIAFSRRPTLTPLLVLLALATTVAAQSVAPASYRRSVGPVTAQPDSLIICEAEEFKVESPGWTSRRWGENYYAATFANAFLSRKAFLGAPEQCENARASIAVRVPAAGRYHVLARYEAAYRFETQFRVQVEQNGKRAFDRLYGARNNVKIWAFSEKLKPEVAWSWGAGENVVWEGHDAFVDLAPGDATITLIADKQPIPAAKRNVDLVMLTTDAEQVKMRIEKESYLPLDGMLTQSGDVWLRVSNRGNSAITFKSGGAPGGGNWQQHSPYWVHLRRWPSVSITVPPNGTSEWTEVGSTMDTLNDGQWNWTVDGPCNAEFAVKDADGKMTTIAAFDASGALQLAGDADTRYSRRLRTQEQVLYDLLDALTNVSQHGRTPKLTPIYASTFDGKFGSKHDEAIARFKQMFALSDTSPDAPGGRGYIDVRGVATDKLADYCAKLGDSAKNIAIVSLGDEIGLPTPGGANVAETFHAWLRSLNIKPADVDPQAGDDWAKIPYDPSNKLKSTRPGVFYWSRRYLQHYGIQSIKQRTDILRQHLPNAFIGANFSPHYPTDHMFLGETFKWVSVFRDDGMTLPWSEDYIWQVPVCTPQVNHISFALFRAGLRNAPQRPIHYYIMPHAPNNTPRMWRRLFYGALGNGMKSVNLFEFRPVQVAYTENHVSDPAMYRMILASFREMGGFEDLIQAGQVMPAQTALWFSETGDIWEDSAGAFAPSKRALYIAVRQQQTPVDVVIERDAIDGTLNQYKVLYLTDRHVSAAASKAIAAWVQRGGVLFATAGAGMRDELDRPNAIMQTLLGVEETQLEAPESEQFHYIKQDLVFAKPLGTVTWSGDAAKAAMPVIAARSRSRLNGATAIGTFDDGSPAIASHDVGKGRTIYCGFQPSLSYFKPAIPMRPFDRGATEDAMVHFLPTQFNATSSALIASALSGVTRPVTCSNPLVEASVVKSKSGYVITLVNWTPTPIKGLRVEVAIQDAPKNAALASGGAIATSQENGRNVYTIDLDAADALILRP